MIISNYRPYWLAMQVYHKTYPAETRGAPEAATWLSNYSQNVTDPACRAALIKRIAREEYHHAAKHS